MLPKGRLFPADTTDRAAELFEDMTILDNLKVASEKHDPWSYLLDLVWPRPSRLSPAASAAIRDFNLQDDLLKRPEDVSFGTRRLVAIARAVATGANVLLLDEPAAGLNDQETAELGALVRTLADTWGVAILLIEHNVQMVMDICDDVYVLNFGHVISHGSAALVREGRPWRCPAAQAACQISVPPAAYRAGPPPGTRVAVCQKAHLPRAYCSRRFLKSLRRCPGSGQPGRDRAEEGKRS